MRFDRRRLTIALALEDNFVEVVDGVEEEVVEVTGAGFYITRDGNVAGKYRFVLARLEGVRNLLPGDDRLGRCG